MIRRAVATIVAALVATSTMAMDQEKAEKVTEVRQAVLEVVGWNIGPMAGMIKERIPYDREIFRRNAGRIAFMLEMVPEAFGPDTREAVLETEALDVIWEDFDEFRDLAGKARDKAAALEATAGSEEFAQVQAAFLEMGEACKACHDKFREED